MCRRLFSYHHFDWLPMFFTIRGLELIMPLHGHTLIHTDYHPQYGINLYRSLAFLIRLDHDLNVLQQAFLLLFNGLNTSGQARKKLFNLLSCMIC